jgi:hypothetical protein
MDTDRGMTKKELMGLLEKEAVLYRAEALATLERNARMHELKEVDFTFLRGNSTLFGHLVDAVLVGFINQVGVGQGVDQGLHTRHLVKKTTAQ